MSESETRSMEARARAAGCAVLDFDIEDGQGFRDDVYGMIDPALMPDGDRVILDRYPNRHAVFGVGPHHCLGAHFGRLDIRITLEEWHRIPNYRVAPGFKPHHHVGSTISMTSLPLLLG
jgi:hypothetical protein